MSTTDRPTIFYLKLERLSDNSFLVGGVVKNAAVNQFVRRNKVLDRRNFARKLKNSKIIVR